MLAKVRSVLSESAVIVTESNINILALVGLAAVGCAADSQLGGQVESQSPQLVWQRALKPRAIRSNLTSASSSKVACRMA